MQSLSLLPYDDHPRLPYDNVVVCLRLYGNVILKYTFLKSYSGWMWFTWIDGMMKYLWDSSSNESAMSVAGF